MQICNYLNNQQLNKHNLNNLHTNVSDSVVIQQVMNSEMEEIDINEDSEQVSQQTITR